MKRLRLTLALGLLTAGCGTSKDGPGPDPAPTTNCDGTAIAADGAMDPFLPLEWHLKNTAGGADLNLGDAWSSTRGDGVLVSVVDDGVDIKHEDLAVNVIPDAGVNFFAGQPGFSASPSDPTPLANASHGTAVAGVIAARDRNGLGVAGVAPRACIMGINLIANGGNTAVQQVEAMTHRLADQAVSNNSWGSTDQLGTLDGDTQEWRDAIDKGVAMGRHGRGIVYLWAAGNGARSRDVAATGYETDNSNYDGQANYAGVMAVCGLMDNGVRVDYSEKGANLWVCGFSQTTDFDQSKRAVSTIDNMGPNGTNKHEAGANPADTALSGDDYANGNYSQQFNGTSAATPTVAGVVALVLKQSPTLTWRDVRLLLAETAAKTDAQDGDWSDNHGTRVDGNKGYHVNHKYGFGRVDAAAALARARDWKPLEAEAAPYDSGERAVNHAFADHDANGASDSVAVSGAAIERIEYVDVYLTASGDIGDLDVRLENSSGSVSVLAEPHNCFAMQGDGTPKQSCGMSFTGWRLGSARHLGESANQTWTLRVSDRRAGHSNGGELKSWRLVIRGRSH